MRTDVEFKTQDGATLAAWHYLPDQHSGKVPTIVMAHGFSAVKEMYLDKFAEYWPRPAFEHWYSTTEILAPVAESRARKSTPGSRSAIIAMRSRLLRHFRRPTQIGLEHISRTANRAAATAARNFLQPFQRSARRAGTAIYVADL